MVKPIAAALLAAVAGNLWAQELPTIREMRFSGQHALDEAALSAAVAPWLDRRTEAGTLLDIQRALQQAYENAGYAMVAVGLPQKIGQDGIVNITIREIAIGHVTLSGVEDDVSADIRAALPSLREGEPLRTDRFNLELRLANDNPSRQIAVSFSQHDGKADADLKVNADKPLRWALGADNTGTAATGRTRMQFTAMHNDLWHSGHMASMSLATSPEKPSSVLQAGLSYALPLPRWGDTLHLSASYSDTNSGRVADTFNISGQGTTLGAHYQLNLARGEHTRHALDLGIDNKRYRNTVDFFGTNLGVDVTARPMSLGYRYDGHAGTTAWHGGLTYARNIAGGGNNDDATYGRSRAGADAHWQAWRARAGVRHGYASDWQVGIDAEWQHTGEPLISGEQFGLGGARSVRGFDERAIAGDRGWRASLELTTPPVAERHRLLGFVDAGAYSRLNPQPGEQASDAVASIGVGWRMAMKNGPTAGADLGVVANGTPQVARGKVKLHFSLQWWF